MLQEYKYWGYKYIRSVCLELFWKKFMVNTLSQRAKSSLSDFKVVNLALKTKNVLDGQKKFDNEELEALKTVTRQRKNLQKKKRLKATAYIQKQQNQLPYQLKPRDGG